MKSVKKLPIILGLLSLIVFFTFAKQEKVFQIFSNEKVLIKWSPVGGAFYNIYRSSDNVNFTLLASKLPETIYTDLQPLCGSNFYRIKVVVGEVEMECASSVVTTFSNLELCSSVYLGITGFNHALTFILFI